MNITRERVLGGLRGGAVGAITGGLIAGMIAEERALGFTQARRDRWLRAWGEAVLAAMGVTVVVAPESWTGARDPAPAGRMVVMNHRSIADIPLLLSRFGGSILAKAEMRAWPVVGAVATRTGTLYVDRSNPTAGAAAIRAVSDVLAEGRTVSVFPEGSTFKGDDVRPFQPGAFVAITRTGGEVVPVGIAYEDGASEYFDEPFGAHAERLLGARRTRVALAVGRPFAVGEQNLRAVSRRAHEEVQSLALRARTLL